MKSVERASRAPFGIQFFLGFSAVLALFVPILWIAWVIRWRKNWPGFAWIAKRLIYEVGKCDLLSFMPPMVFHNCFVFPRTLAWIHCSCEMIKWLIVCPNFALPNSLFRPLMSTHHAFRRIPFPRKSFHHLPDADDNAHHFSCPERLTYLILISWLLDLPFASNFGSVLVHKFVAIWQLSPILVLWRLFRGLPICFQIWFLLLELARFTYVLYVSVAWFTVLLFMIYLILFNLPLPQATCFTLLAIYWDSLDWLLLPYLSFSYLTSLNLFAIMAFSPNARAHASTSRPIHHNWPNPFLRPAANEPPRVVNINGITITVDRNETHIPVPRPPPHFLNHYQSFCLVGKIFGTPVSATVVQEKCLANWQGLLGTVTIERLGNLWFRIIFTQEEDLVYVLDNRPWFVKGRIFHLRRWTPSFSATYAKMDKLIVWVRLPFLPLHLWDPDTLERIVQVLGRYIRVDEATAMGDHCIFARVCIEVDLRCPLKRVIVLHPENQEDEVYRIRVSYEALFEICFNCGNFSHRYEACPMRLTDRHFVLVDRLDDEPTVYPPEMQQLEEVQHLISNDALVIFPQPTYGYQPGTHVGEGQREEHEQSDQDTRS